MCGSLLRPDSHPHLLNASNLKIAERRMLEEKVLRGEDIIVSSDGKTIERIPAK